MSDIEAIWEDDERCDRRGWRKPTFAIMDDAPLSLAVPKLQTLVGVPWDSSWKLTVSRITLREESRERQEVDD